MSYTERAITENDRDPIGPFWRAAQIFRLLSFCYAGGFQLAINGDLLRPATTWTLFVLLTVANIWWAIGYLVGFGRRWWFVVIELAVAAAMMASTTYVADSSWIAANQTWPTTLWCANAVLSAALLRGPWWGAAAGLVIGLTNFYVKGEVFLNFGQNATLLLLVATGVALGLAAARARAMQDRVTAAVQIAAQAEERDRLAREVHDGVLQVLALISRQGRQIGGPTADLADLAAEQERRLRTLIADGPRALDTGLSGTGVSDTEVPGTGVSVDLGGALRALGTARISVSAPAEPVPVPPDIATEALAATQNILRNSELHAGPSAHSYILIEDLGDHLVLTVRDDGPGIPAGRVAAAAADGRLGIAQSIVGRVEAIGGTATLETSPGDGTEWELTIPLPARPI